MNSTRKTIKLDQQLEFGLNPVTGPTPQNPHKTRKPIHSRVQTYKIYQNPTSFGPSNPQIKLSNFQALNFQISISNSQLDGEQIH